jgi:hypothetical protein
MICIFANIRGISEGNNCPESNMQMSHSIKIRDSPILLTSISKMEAEFSETSETVLTSTRWKDLTSESASI